jgi:hypothetical protein
LIAEPDEDEEVLDMSSGDLDSEPEVAPKEVPKQSVTKQVTISNFFGFQEKKVVPPPEPVPVP